MSVTAAPKFDSEHNIEVFDAGEKVPDRYTVVYKGEPVRGYPGVYECVGMSEDPFHPLGIGQHGTAAPGEHLGRRITFRELPADCQRIVLRDLDLDQPSNQPRPTA